jgi:predicted nucleic acid-binding protein
MNVGIDTDFLVRLAVIEHADHEAAERVRDERLDAGDRFAVAPQVVAEFVHVVTDGRRFARPLSPGDALAWAQAWWTAAEVDPIAPSGAAMEQFFDWMLKHRLGRKRILDTLLAATYVAAGITHLVTGNGADYRIFDGLELIELQ